MIMNYDTSLKVRTTLQKKMSKDKLSPLHPYISMLNLHPHCSLHISPLGLKLSWLVVVSFNLVTLRCDSGVIF